MNLEVLDLSGNQFSELPHVVYKLNNLIRLNLSENRSLVKLDEEILQLKHLEQLGCEDCYKLTFPPYAVCQQGLPAVRKYILDYISEQGVALTQVPVSFVGKAFSGKTSVIRSLQKGKRVLTIRKERSALDETTKVFNIEELQLPTSMVRIIDHGGHEAYHLVYQLVIRDQCVPVVVVNMEMFDNLSKTNGPKEATRHLCFNWLSHLYLACPNLGSPVLILTHIDKLTVEQYNVDREMLLSMSEIIRREILDDEQQCSSSSPQVFTPIRHIRDTTQPLFNPEEIFEFSNDPNDTSNIERLIQTLDSRCKEFTIRLPRLWEKVESFIEEHKHTPYIPLSSVTRKFGASDPEVILQYMHDSGKILWFRKVNKLSQCVFHRPAAITEIIALLFHHSADEQWQKRLDIYSPFDHKQKRVKKEKFKSFVEQFTSEGLLDEALLMHLFNDQPQFDSEVALALLQHFYILHGPIQCQRRTAYILPFFSSTFMSSSWETDKEIQLRIDLMIRGLPIPWYVFQLVTVAVLNQSLTEFDVPYVKRNGLTIRQDQTALHLVHDFNNGKITVQVSTSVQYLGESWKLLVKTTIAILELLSKTWKACHVELLLYCAHCLFLRDVQPDFKPDPEWFYEIYNQNSPASLDSMYSGVKLVPCRRCLDHNKELYPSVPKPLRFPCKFMVYTFFFLII